MDSVAAWQVVSLLGLLSWIMISSALNMTQRLRSLIQPWVIRHVATGTPLIVKIQKSHHTSLDTFFSALSCVVSVSFYTGFLPILFWSGHVKLARQMTLLMAFCDYLGNCVKDVVSAPRPSCPPVRRVAVTGEEIENTHEYGLPSSHTLNTVCLSGYLLCYILSNNYSGDSSVRLAAIAVVCFHIGLTGFGRIYLGMHSLIDVIGGLVMGLVILTFWLTVHEYIDNFVALGQNVTSFWAALSILLLFAYPTPEFPTPSFEFHTAFNGVALGIVAGVHQNYQHFHHESVPQLFTTPELTLLTLLARVLVGIPTILLVKFCSKAIAKWILPILLGAMGFPVRSTGYIPALNGASPSSKNSIPNKQLGFVQKMFFTQQDSFDIDTGIRFVQYAGLAWAVVDLVPSLFSQLNL